MGTELKPLKNTGSRGIELSVTRYWGGDKHGTCFQLKGEMEEGGIGYVQLSKKDIRVLYGLTLPDEENETA